MRDCAAVHRMPVFDRILAGYRDEGISYFTPDAQSFSGCRREQVHTPALICHREHADDGAIVALVGRDPHRWSLLVVPMPLDRPR